MTLGFVQRISVALRKESVDRNTGDSVLRIFTKSLSARRAWIEISCESSSKSVSSVALRKESVDRNDTPAGTCRSSNVALRKESVDRNFCQGQLLGNQVLSLSARRAWIEIQNGGGVRPVGGRRSPQGERG